MREPLVSILVPVFNGARFLSECLESILAQDFTDYEALISDDGSTDGSGEIIERFAQRDARIRRWRNPRTLGIGGNFNACLHAARGEFVKYVLQDDLLLDPAAVRRQLTLLQADPSASLAVSAAQLIDAQSRPVRVRGPFRRSGVYDGQAILVKCLEENANLIGEPSLAMFRRRQGARGYDEGLKQLLDLELWFYLLEQGRLAYIAEPLCAFRQHPNQQTEVNRQTRAAAGEYLALVERYAFKPWMRRAATLRMRGAVIYYLRKKHGEPGARLADRLAREISPSGRAAGWFLHKTTVPFRNLGRWLRKRGLTA